MTDQPRSQEAALDVDLMREHAEEAIEYGYKHVEVDPAALLRVLDRAALAATPPEDDTIERDCGCVDDAFQNLIACEEHR